MATALFFTEEAAYYKRVYQQGCKHCGAYPRKPTAWPQQSAAEDISPRKFTAPPNCRASINTPKATEPKIIDARYTSSVRVPSTLRTTSIEAMLHAGPAISNTNAAPGVSPLSISATAIGIDPVAQRYIGMAIASTSNIDAHVLPWNTEKRLSGTSTVIAPAAMMPITSHLPMSSIISTKA